MPTPKSGAVIISVLNMKGGVGKTTLAVNLAYGLAHFFGKKVLLIDIDPQFNATQYLMEPKTYVQEYIENNKRLTTLNIFKDKVEPRPSIVTEKSAESTTPELTLENIIWNVFSNANGKLDLVPSTLQLMDIEYGSYHFINKVKNFTVKIRGMYDYIFLDCPPTMSIFTISSYVASDAVLIPIKPDFLSSLGLPLLLRSLQRLKVDFAHDVIQLGVVFNMVKLMRGKTTESSRFMNKVGTQMQKFNVYVFNNYLKESTYISRSVETHTPIFFNLSAKKHWAAVRNITEEFLNRAEHEFV